MYRALNRLTVPQLFALVRAASMRIVREYPGRAEDPIPHVLLEIYNEAVLRTHGVELLGETA